MSELADVRRLVDRSKFEVYKQHADCPKCGQSMFTTDYSPVLDLMIRKCANCSYELKQLPLDTKELVKTNSSPEKIEVVKTEPTV